MAKSMQGKLSLAVREPVWMDVAFHGVRTIIAEFAVATLLLVGLAVLQLALWLTRGDAATHGPWAAIFGVWSVNALTFMLLAREEQGNDATPARSDFTHGAIFVYTIEAVVLLLLPLVFPLLALVQRPQH